MKQRMALCLLATLAACGGDGGGGAPAKYTVGGSIAGLTASGLVLANGSDTVQPGAGATNFTLGTSIASGATYQVTVEAQPSGLTCTTQSASGTMGNSNVTSVAVSCTPDLQGIGGTVTGLTGAGLVLRNGSETVQVAAGATQFTLPGHAAGTTYAVAVQAQPAGQVCTVSAGSGTLGSQPVTNIQVACGGQTLYVAGNGSHVVDILPLDASGMPRTADFTQVAGDGNVRRLAMTPDARHLYAIASGENAIDLYDIAVDGTLTRAEPKTVATGDNPLGLVVTPDGRFAYATSQHTGSIDLYAVGSDGVPSALSPASITLDSAGMLTISPDGHHLYTVSQTGAGAVAMYAIGSDGQLSPLATPTIPAGGYADAIVLTPDGKYAYANNGSSIREFALQSDGTLARIGDVSANLTGGQDLTISPDGRFVYVPDYGANVVVQYAIGTDGLLTPLATPTVAAGVGPVSVAIGADGRKAYVANLLDSTVAVFDVGSDGSLVAASKVTFAVSQPYHLLLR
jgi:6-phosphogluconolactonase (cycloisomerase 2 family)